MYKNQFDKKEAEKTAKIYINSKITFTTWH